MRVPPNAQLASTPSESMPQAKRHAHSGSDEKMTVASAEERQPSAWLGFGFGFRFGFGFGFGFG